MIIITLVFLWPDPWLLLLVPLLKSAYYLEQVVCALSAGDYEHWTQDPGHKDPRLEEPGPKDLRTQGPGTRRPSLESCVELHQGIK